MAVATFGNTLTIVTWAIRLISLVLNTWVSSPCISNLSVSACGWSLELHRLTVLPGVQINLAYC